MKSTKLCLFFLTALFLFQVLGLIESKTKLRNNSNSITNQNQKAKVYLEAVIDGEKKCLYSKSKSDFLLFKKCDKSKDTQWDIEYNSNTKKIIIQSSDGNYLNNHFSGLMLRGYKYEWEFKPSSNGKYIFSKFNLIKIDFEKDKNSNYILKITRERSGGLEFNILSVSDDVITQIKL
jgi:hypothetical protein